MVKKRLKYFNINGWIIGESILCNGELLHVRITKDKDKFIYSISNSVCAIYSSKTNSIANAKRLSKQKLKEFGAIFGDEVRNKEII